MKEKTRGSIKHDARLRWSMCGLPLLVMVGCGSMKEKTRDKGCNSVKEKTRDGEREN